MTTKKTLAAKTLKKKLAEKKTAKPRAKAKKPAVKKTAVAKPARKNQTKKLNIWMGPGRSLTLTFKLNKKKAPAKKRKSPARKRSKKTASFEKNLILSFVFISAGIMGSVYASAQIFGGSVGHDKNIEAQSFFVGSSVKQEDDNFLSRSVPARLKVPAVGINTKLTVAGKNQDGTLEVPEDYDIAGWYKYGPTPGEKGPAVIAGHVNRDHGPGVFGALYLIKKGQVIEVTRKDGKTALFKVDVVKQFPQNKDFPTEAVYGNIDHAGLRLITCAGDFNYMTGRYSENTVVFASFWKLKNKKS